MAERDQIRGLLAIVIALTGVVALDLLGASTRSLALAAVFIGLTANLRMDLPARQEGDDHG